MAEVIPTATYPFVPGGDNCICLAVSIGFALAVQYSALELVSAIKRKSPSLVAAAALNTSTPAPASRNRCCSSSNRAKTDDGGARGPSEQIHLLQQRVRRTHNDLVWMQCICCHQRENSLHTDLRDARSAQTLRSIRGSVALPRTPDQKRGALLALRNHLLFYTCWARKSCESGPA